MASSSGNTSRRNGTSASKPTTSKPALKSSSEGNTSRRNGYQAPKK